MFHMVAVYHALGSKVKSLRDHAGLPRAWAGRRLLTRPAAVDTMKMFGPATTGYAADRILPIVASDRQIPVPPDGMVEVNGQMTEEKIARINALSQKARTPEGLTEAEHEERRLLREEYIAAFRMNLQVQLDNMYVLDEHGNERKLERRSKAKH